MALRSCVRSLWRAALGTCILVAPSIARFPLRMYPGNEGRLVASELMLVPIR